MASAQLTFIKESEYSFGYNGVVADFKLDLRRDNIEGVLYNFSSPDMPIRTGLMRSYPLVDGEVLYTTLEPTAIMDLPLSEFIFVNKLLVYVIPEINLTYTCVYKEEVYEDAPETVYKTVSPYMSPNWKR